MPFRRGYRSNKRRFTRRSRYKRPMRVMTVKKVRKIVGAELKHATASAALVIGPIAGQILDLTSGIAQGNLSANRQGNWIQPIVQHGHINLTASVIPPVSTQDVTEIRFGFLRWKEDTNTNLPSLDQIMENVANVLGPFKYASKGKFDILWSRVTTIVNDRDNNQFNKNFRYYFKLGRGQRCIYDNATPMKYMIIFFAISNSPVGEELDLQLNNVIRYTDS